MKQTKKRRKTLDQYREVHKKEISLSVKKYYTKHKWDIDSYRRKWIKDNYLHIKKYKATWYKANKDKVKVKYKEAYYQERYGCSAPQKYHPLTDDY